MKLVEMINAREQRAAVPGPNEVKGKYVMECLATDDEGNGMLFASILENKLLYATSTGSWYVWRGHCWQRDNVNLVLSLVRYVTERYGEEIVELEEKIQESKDENDPEEHRLYSKSWERIITQLQKKISYLRKDKGRNACVKFAHTHFGNPFSIEGNEFDQDPW